MTASDSYRLAKLARLERQNAALHRHRERLERCLAVALRVAVGGTGVEPVVLLGAIEAVDERVDEPLSEKVVRVRRETA